MPRKPKGDPVPINEYKKEWMKKRKEKSDKIRKGEIPPGTNMLFFSRLLKQLNLTYKQVSELTQYSQQLISWWITSDDCKLSKIEDVFDKLGLKITCRFQPKPGKEMKVIDNDYILNIHGIPRFESDVQGEKNPVLEQALLRNGRMKWLAEFILSLSPTLVDFCKEYEVLYYSAYHWFIKDDIKISKLMYIAEKTEQKVVWTLERKLPGTKTEQPTAASLHKSNSKTKGNTE